MAFLTLARIWCAFFRLCSCPSVLKCSGPGFRPSPITQQKREIFGVIIAVMCQHIEARERIGFLHAGIPRHQTVGIFDRSYIARVLRGGELDHPVLETGPQCRRAVNNLFLVRADLRHDLGPGARGDPLSRSSSSKTSSLSPVSMIADSSASRSSASRASVSASWLRSGSYLSAPIPFRPT